jgi:hypothetical protein
MNVICVKSAYGRALIVTGAYHQIHPGADTVEQKIDRLSILWQRVRTRLKVKAVARATRFDRYGRPRVYTGNAASFVRIGGCGWGLLCGQSSRQQQAD